MANCITANMTSDVRPHVVTKDSIVYDVINVTIDKTPAEIYETAKNEVPVIVTGLFPIGINEDGSTMLIKVPTYVEFSHPDGFHIKDDNWFYHGEVNPVSPPPGLFAFKQGPSNNSVLEVVYAKE